MSHIDLGVTSATALPGRPTAIEISAVHAIFKTPMAGPFESWETAVFALGCFWGAERIFWKMDGVRTTAVGYIAGFTENPAYEEVCSGRTGHTEAVLVGFDPEVIRYSELLQQFWQSHDPTQGMRQGNDRGTQYRSGIYTYGEQQAKLAASSKDRYQEELASAGFPTITTEIAAAGEFYYAEEYHQQYLHKNPQGYCGIGGTGVSCAIGLDLG
ncbi:MAG: peptide-methionine (S)-S-oxide reductase MsrA [Kofleriaceae bacterium]|nr:peptide-methionine (S)-S-oxide reductase MsrA [Kofleriaceae bacterium]